MRKIKREAIRRDLRNQREKKKKPLSDYFKQVYDATKEFNWPEKEGINVQKHFYFPKDVLENSLSKTALALYPVFCSCADFKKDEWFQLPQQHIARLAGVSINAVVKGSRELEAAGLLERKKKTEGVRHFYLYRAAFVRQDMMKDYKGGFFIFHACIIDSGIWAKLKKPRAKALYLALRSAAYFDPDLYAEIEGIDDEGKNDIYNVEGEYRNRKWDFCHTTLSELCRMVGINRSDIEPALEQLEDYRLIEKYDHGFFKVYLKPQFRWVEAAEREEPIKPITSGEVVDGRTMIIGNDGSVDIITDGEYME